MKRIAFLAASAVAVIVAVVAMLAASLTATPAPAAVAQSTPPPPANQQARNTGTPGEVIVTWNAAAGANSYRVGWLNHADYLAAGNTWLQRFTFADVPSSVRSYRVTRLTPGEEYWFIVASVDARNQMYWPSSWIQKFAVTAAPTPTPAPTPTACPNVGFGPGAPTGGSSPTPTPSGSSCPAGSGSHLPPGAKMTPGNFVNWGGFRFGVRSVTTPSTVEFSDGSRDGPPHGRRWLLVNIDARNGRTSTVYMSDGHDYAVETDAGIAYSWNADTEIPANRWYPNGLNLLFDIPSNASTAVVHLRPLTFQSGNTNTGVMWQVNIP